MILWEMVNLKQWPSMRQYLASTPSIYGFLFLIPPLYGWLQKEGVKRKTSTVFLPGL